MGRLTDGQLRYVGVKTTPAILEDVATLKEPTGGRRQTPTTAE